MCKVPFIIIQIELYICDKLLSLQIYILFEINLHVRSVTWSHIDWVRKEIIFTQLHGRSVILCDHTQERQKCIKVQLKNSNVIPAMLEEGPSDTRWHKAWFHFSPIRQLPYCSSLFLFPLFYFLFHLASV